MMSYQIQVTGDWAGSSLQGWRPAVAGTLNQTGLSDEEASTFATEEEAHRILDEVLVPEIATDPVDGDLRDVAPRFRVVGV